MLQPLKKRRIEGKGGYISLMSVIILGSLGVVVSTSVILLGLGSSRSGYAYDQSNSALSITEACIEEGLQKIRQDDSYTGSGELLFTIGTCTYTVEDIPNSQKRVSASGIMGESTHRIYVDTNSIRPQITLSNWQEVAD